MAEITDETLTVDEHIARDRKLVQEQRARRLRQERAFEADIEQIAEELRVTGVCSCEQCKPRT